jgi:hypothetical protein
MSVSRIPSSRPSTLNQATEVSPSKGYRVIKDDGIASKSLKSKVKNLLYTLSSPLRALTRQHVQSKLSNQGVATGMINIKSATSSASNRTTMTVQASLADAVITMSQGTAKFKPPPTDIIWG